jgi:hypothetical protein
LQRAALQHTSAEHARALQFVVQTVPEHCGWTEQLSFPVQLISATVAVALTPPVHELTPPHEIVHCPETQSIALLHERSTHVTSQLVPRHEIAPPHELVFPHAIRQADA